MKDVLKIPKSVNKKYVYKKYSNHRKIVAAFKLPYVIGFNKYKRQNCKNENLFTYLNLFKRK